MLLTRGCGRSLIANFCYSHCTLCRNQLLTLNCQMHSAQAFSNTHTCLYSALFPDIIVCINHDFKRVLKPTVTVIRPPQREALNHSNYSSVGIPFLHKWLFTSQVRTFCFIGQFILVSVSSSCHVCLCLLSSKQNVVG